MGVLLFVPMGSCRLVCGGQYAWYSRCDCRRVTEVRRVMEDDR